MRFLVIFISTFAVVIAQRPSFAGQSAKGYPELAARFRDTASSDSSGSSTLDVVNRVGEVSSTTTLKIPVESSINDVPPGRRPSFAGQSAKGYPNVAPRFRGTSPSPDVLNRAGEASSTTSTTTTTTAAIDAAQNSNDSIIRAIATGQRPSFAGQTAKGYPDLAPRFRETSSPDVVNRLGEGGSITTEKIVVVTDEFLERVKQWPRENQPFSVLNAAHIERHLHPEREQEQQVKTRSVFVDDYFNEPRPIRLAQPRSSFLGPLEGR